MFWGLLLFLCFIVFLNSPLERGAQRAGLRRLLLHLLQYSVYQLICTGSSLVTTGYTFKLLDDFFCRHAFHQYTDRLQISRTAAIELHIFYNTILYVKFYLFGTYASCVIRSHFYRSFAYFTCIRCRGYFLKIHRKILIV